MERVDIAIIGTGPAGISAAINAKIRKKSFYLFGPNTLSEKIRRSELIMNYPGMPAVTGEELNASLRRHLEEMGIGITEKRITGIFKMRGYYYLLADQEEFEARCVIFAAGVEATKPVPGERDLLGHGVSYCATCDGHLYKGKTIAVVCDNPGMEEEVLYLAELADKVYFEAKYKDPGVTAPNVERLSSPIAAVLGEGRTGGIRLKDGTEIPLSGVFFLKQSVSPAVLLKGLETENGQVKVDRRMATNKEGCFACGDCTGAPYQIAKAVGEGNIAAHSAVAYLAEKS